MIKTVKFSGEITHESIEKLISRIEEIEKEVSPITIYFSSGGGSVTDAQVFIDFINAEPERYELIGCFHITSAAFYVFMKVKCKKRILDYTFAMLHLISNDLDYLEMQKKNSYTRFHQQELTRENDDFLKYVQELGLPENEITRIKEGEEVYLDDCRIRELIAKQSSQRLEK